MNIIKISFFILFILASKSLFAENPEHIFIQFNDKYLSLQKAASIRNDLHIEQINNQLKLKYGNSYYAITSKNVALIFNREHLILDFKNTYPNANIYLDNYFLGTTDNNGLAHFPQIYPELGKHKLSMNKNKIHIPIYNFKLETSLIISCTGKDNFICQKNISN